MFNEIKDSIKARLHDSTSTPFLGSFTISWIFINRVYILIYFGDFKDKLSLLEAYSFGEFYYKMWFFPLIIALSYVYIYPWFLKHFFSYTLKKQKERYDLKQDIEKEKLLSVEKSREIKSALHRLEDELDKKDEKILYYKNEIEKLENKKSNVIPYTLPTKEEGALYPRGESNKDTKVIPKNKYNIHDEIFDKFSDEFTQDEIVILNAIYDSSIANHSSLSSYIKDIQKHVDMPKAKIELLLKGLEKKKYLTLGATNSPYTFDLTMEGKAKVVEMFDK